MDVVDQPRLGERGPGGGRDHRLPLVGLAAVAEDQLAAVDAAVALALLLQLVLHLEQIGEVGVRLDLHLQVQRLLVVVDEGDLLVEAAVDLALADHRQVRVDVDGAGGQRREELHLVVGQIVRRQQLGADAVDGEDPARQEAGVVEEEPMVLGGRGLEVAARIADHEGVALEDGDGVERHD
jgi:hypothetical protein